MGCPGHAKGLWTKVGVVAAAFAVSFCGGRTPSMKGLPESAAKQKPATDQTPDPPIGTDTSVATTSPNGDGTGGKPADATTPYTCKDLLPLAGQASDATPVLTTCLTAT